MALDFSALRWDGCFCWLGRLGGLTPKLGALGIGSDLSLSGFCRHRATDTRN